MVPIDLHGQRFDATGAWYWLAEWLYGHDGIQTGARLRFCSTAERIELRFHAHPWSGIAEARVNGALFRELDLFNESTGVPRRCVIENPDRATLVVEIVPTGRKRPAALGRQCILEGVLEHDGTFAVARYAKAPPVNRGGSFPEQMLRALGELPADALLLDVGGGRRQIRDTRYLNMEYTSYDEPDLLGDALALPFRDASVDIVYSSAVMEHLRDPHQFGREIWRVLKPGGRILVNSAFMQPVHSEGMHFFNATPYAMELVFERFADRHVWWEGSLSDTVRWMLNVAGATARADPSEVRGVLDTLRRLDGLITYEGLMYVASGVWIAARKPPA
jgi:hypothetical protein